MADFDAVVIGSGAGGGAAANALVRSGKRVLLLDRAPIRERPKTLPDTRTTLIDMAFSDQTLYRLNGHDERLPFANVLGGGTGLYGALMVRPSSADFQPGRHYGNKIPKAVWDWPITFDCLEPFLEEAEDAYQVAGPNPSSIPHFGSRKTPYVGHRSEVSPFAQRMMDKLEKNGLQPFQLPVAVDDQKCLRCTNCAAYPCPTGARRGAYEAFISRLFNNGSLTVWADAKVDRLNFSSRRCKSVLGTIKDQTFEVSASTVVLAAGAIHTPLLLVESGYEDKSGQLGRNHMCHSHILRIYLFSNRTHQNGATSKDIGLADFYMGTPEYQEKLGLVSQLPTPDPVLVSAVSGIPHSIAKIIGERSLNFSGLVEDLPSPNNTVFKKNGVPFINRTFQDYDIKRSGEMNKVMQKLGRELGAITSTRLPDATVNKRGIVHQVGTCRFGDDPATAVADRFGRIHSLDNVFIADGSLLPTSLGVNPALTISALGLWVGSHVASVFM